MEDKSNKKTIALTLSILVGIVLAGICVGIYSYNHTEKGIIDTNENIIKEKVIEVECENKEDDKNKDMNQSEEDSSDESNIEEMSYTVANLLQDIIIKNKNDLVNCLTEISNVLTKSRFYKYFGLGSTKVNPLKEEEIRETIEQIEKGLKEIPK